MKWLRMLGLASVLTYSLTGLDVARAAPTDWGCYVECCEIGYSVNSRGATVDEAWQNLSCEGHGGMCGTIECDPIID